LEKEIAMFEYIRELLGLADDELDEVRDLHAFWVPKIVVGLDLLLLVGFFLNLGGLMWVNLVFAWIVASAMIILATRPEGPVIATSLGALSGATQEPQTVPQQLKEFLKLYAQWSAGVLFWTSGILFLLGTIPVEENPGGALVILVAAIVISSYVIYKKKELSITSWIIYVYAIFMIITLLFSLVPGHTWLHYTGYDPKGIFTANPTEVRINKIKTKAEKARQAENDKILRVMERKAEQSGGKPLDEVLTPDELELFVKLSKQSDARSWRKKLSEVSWPSWPSRAEAKIEPKPEPVVKYQPPQVAELPVTPPRQPYADPKPRSTLVSILEWELSEEIPGWAPTRHRVKIFFHKDFREIVIERVDGATTIYNGFRDNLEQGEFEGHWVIQAPNYRDGSGKFYFKFANPDNPQKWEYARGWRIINGKKSPLELKKLILLPNHGE
jgi:hypothetical protein